jgi:hypothetical protein
MQFVSSEIVGTASSPRKAVGNLEAHNGNDPGPAHSANHDAPSGWFVELDLPSFQTHTRSTTSGLSLWFCHLEP